MLPWVCSVIDHRGRQNVVKTSVTHCFYHILSHLWSITEQTHGNIPCEQRLYFHCVSYRAKEASSDSRSIFYRACAKISTPFAVIKWREFAGIEKIATSLICYAQLKQCSKPVNMVKNRKNPFFLIYSSRFLDRFERLSADRGYFSHDSLSHSENVASARRVKVTWNLFVKHILGWRHWKLVLFVLFNMARGCETISD